jgi:hypothetical protein
MNIWKFLEVKKQSAGRDYSVPAACNIIKYKILLLLLVLLTTKLLLLTFFWKRFDVVALYVLITAPHPSSLHNARNLQIDTGSGSITFSALG